jgi:Mo-dependent nitrogenase C-terminus
MNASKHDETKASTLVSWGWVEPSGVHSSASPLKPPAKPWFDLLAPLRQWLDHIEVKDAEFAHMVCKRIPSQCPFERRVQFKGRTLLYIPPLCKLNPVYDEVVGLRFRALCYLADVCGEDVSSYC